MSSRAVADFNSLRLCQCFKNMVVPEKRAKQMLLALTVACWWAGHPFDNDHRRDNPNQTCYDEIDQRRPPRFVAEDQRGQHCRRQGVDNDECDNGNGANKFTQSDWHSGSSPLMTLAKTMPMFRLCEAFV